MLTLRSLLFVPGNRPDMFPKAARSSADALVLDLEDSIPLAQIEAARANVVEWLDGPGQGCATCIRIGAPDEGRLEQDVSAVTRPALQMILIPKVDDAATLIEVDRLLAGHERRLGMRAQSVRLLPIAESAVGVSRLPDILAATPRIVGTIFAGGANGDLRGDLGCGWSAQGTELLFIRSKIVLDCRAQGKTVILDGLHAQLDDDEGLAADTRFGRLLGYTGRMAVHPRQLDVIHQVYRPSEAELASAASLIAAFDAAEARGSAAIRHEGRLVDRAMRKHADSVLRRNR